MPIVMDADRIARSLTRMAHEILERHRGMETFALVGIRARGVPLAQRAQHLVAIRDPARGHLLCPSQGPHAAESLATPD